MTCALCCSITALFGRQLQWRREWLLHCKVGTNIVYCTISHLFGVGMSTAFLIVHEVSKAIVDPLLDKDNKIPQEQAAMDISRSFEEKWDYLQCFESGDDSHIPIIPLMIVPQTISTQKGISFNYGANIGGP